MLDFLSKEKQKTLLKYPFIREYIRGKLAKIMFLVNLKGFETQLIEDGITEHDIENLKKLKPKGISKTPKPNKKLLFAGLAVALVFMFIFGPNLFAGETEEAVGELVYKDGKAIIKKGQTVAVSGYQVSSVDNAVVVYKKCPSEGLKGNSVCISDEQVLLSSDAEGSVTVEVEAGNELFDTFKAKHERDEKGRLVQLKLGDEEFSESDFGYRSKVIPDEDDNLKMIVSGGDSITIKQEEEKIPLVTHSRTEEGTTVIENGRITFNLGEEFSYDVKTFENEVEFNEINNGKYESIAFQLQSDSLKEGKQLRIGSNNQFALVNPEDIDKPVIYNKYGIAISQNQNQIQTMDQLQEKWIRKLVTINYIKRPLGEYKEPSPFAIQLVDQWLEKTPNPELHYISFSDLDNAMSGDPIINRKGITRPLYDSKGEFIGEFPINGILLGEQILDPYRNSELPRSRLAHRNFEFPLSTIIHEYEHVTDNIIGRKDEYAINKAIKEAMENNKLKSGAEKKAKDKADKLMKLVEKDPYSELVSNRTNDAILLIMSEDNSQVDNMILGWDYDRRNRILKSVGYEKYIQQYGDKDNLATKEDVDSHLKKIEEQMSLNKEKEEYVNELIKRFRSDAKYVKEGHTLNEAMNMVSGDLLTSEEYGDLLKEKMYEYAVKIETERNIADSVLNDPATKPLKEYYNEIVFGVEQNLVKDKKLKKKYSVAIENLRKNKDKFEEKEKELAEEIIVDYESNKKTNVQFINTYGIFVEKCESCAESYQEMAQYLVDESGLPAPYALFNYGKNRDLFNELTYNLDSFSELSSTFREESIEERRKKLHKGTSAQKKIYHKLTQLAFDSGKMPVEEFKQIMGENYCKEPACVDKKCCLYKSTNCVGECS